jgi:hypothetical protein
MRTRPGALPQYLVADVADFSRLMGADEESAGLRIHGDNEKLESDEL